MSCVRLGESKRHAWPAHVWQSCWKELETLSNQERSSGCYPFNYVVWVSTVITGEAGRGRTGGGLCVCVCIYVAILCGSQDHLCVYVCKLWGLMLFMLWMCVCRSEHLQMCRLSACVQPVCYPSVSPSGFSDSFIFQIWAIWNTFVFPAAGSKDLAVTLYPVFFILITFSWTFFSSFVPFLSSFSPTVCLHLCSLLLISRCSFSRWQTLLGHRYRLPRNRCRHLS